MNTLPAWMKDPEVVGNWLATRLAFAKNTSPRLNQVSRVDAICWFLTLRPDFVASSKEIKAFATAFRGTGGKVGCCSLSCYGGVANDFSGEIGNRYFCPKNYGPKAPLWRPVKHHYSPTVSGVERAARCQRILDLEG